MMDCYIRLPVCSALYARNAQYARGPSSLHDPLIEAVRLFPCLWQVNNKSYNDVVAKANENFHVAGVGQNWPCPEPPLPHPPFVPSEQSKRSSVSSYSSSLEPFILFHLLNFFTNYARAFRLIIGFTWCKRWER